MLTLLTVTMLTAPCSSATLLPFGGGQFANGKVELGATFALMQTAAIATNIVSFVEAQDSRASAARDLVVAQYASLALFGLLWSAGALEARSNCDYAPALLQLGPTGVPPTPAAAELSAFGALPPLPPATHPLSIAPCPDDGPATCESSDQRALVTFVLAGSWADVYVDGVLAARNRMGTFSLPMELGEHIIRFENPYAEPREVQVVVHPEGAQGRVVVRLRPLE